VCSSDLIMQMPGGCVAMNSFYRERLAKTAEVKN